MNEKQFVQFVADECNHYGVKFRRGSGRYVLNDGQKCSGYFDDNVRELACAMGRPDWLSILAHEYSHLTQWRDRCKPWTDAIDAGSYDAWTRHMKGERVDMDRHFCLMRDLELDNERRTARLIKRLNLPIDLDTYVRKANAYVMLYNWMRETGRWPGPKNSPYNNERIISAMPTRFSLDYSKMPERLAKLYREEGV